MRHRLLILPFLAALAIYLGTACGTTMNLAEDKNSLPIGGVPFGGVANSLVYGGVWQWEAVQSGKKGEVLAGAAMSTLGLYVWLIDMPLSAAGDVITMPYILYRCVDRAFGRPADAEAEPTETPAEPVAPALPWETPRKNESTQPGAPATGVPPVAGAPG